MSEWCAFRCGRRSQGSIGLMRYCMPCFAELAGWRRNDRRLRERVTVQLHDDGEPIGLAEWVPDCAAAKERRQPVSS